MSAVPDPGDRPSAIENPVPPELRKIWDRIPEMKDCKGLCHTSCGPVPINGIEKKLIEDRDKKMEVHDGANGPMTCSLLTEDGKCSVYSVRPLMCRAWGAVKSLPCPYGCVPEHYLSDADVFFMLQEVARISGDTEDAAMTNMLEILGPELARIWEATTGKKAKEAAQHMIETGQGIEWREPT